MRVSRSFWFAGRGGGEGIFWAERTRESDWESLKRKKEATRPVMIAVMREMIIRRVL